MDLSKVLVRHILAHATDYDWSLQGFGMLRLHLTDSYRLNVWDSRYRVPNVSLIHTHPWDFTSTIVAGELENIRFVESLVPFPVTTHSKAVIIPGPGGGLHNQLSDVALIPRPAELYDEGSDYIQLADEIHLSNPKDGTVTFNQRKRVGDDKAFVYWPIGEQWVSAEPRGAAQREIEDICQNSLATWFNEA